MERSDSRLNMGWKPNPSLDLPLYRQIEAYIRQKITTGEWSAGYRLPSQRIWAESMGVNRSTLVTALDNLAAAGLLEGRHGGELIFPAPVGMAWLMERYPTGMKPSRRVGIIPTCQRFSRLIRLNSDLASYGLVQGACPGADASGCF